MEPIDSAFPEFQQAVLDGKRRMDRLLAPLCGVAALIYYLVLCPAALPAGIPAELTAITFGIPAQTPPFHLIWRALAWVAAAIPAGTMALKLAVLSAACTALAAGLVYQVAVELMMHRLIPNGTRIDALKVRAIQVGGVSAAIAFATTIPVALAGTRASLRAMDALLPAAGVLLFLRYLDGARVPMLLLSAIVCGLGMGEGLGSVLLFVVLTIWGIVVLWQQEKGSLPALAFAGLGLFTALLVYPGLSYLWGLPGGGTSGLLAVHWNDLQADYGTRTGLFLAALALFPLILTLATLQQTLNYGEEYEALLTNIALAVASVLVLTNAFPSFHFYALSSPEPTVIPSLLAAMTAGFVAASWWAVGFSPSTPGAQLDETDLHHEGTPPVVRGLGYGVAIAFTMAILFSATWTARTLRGLPAQYAQRCAERMLDEIGTRGWIFGHTPANTHLSVMARERHLPIQVLPLTSGHGWSPILQARVRQAIRNDPVFRYADRDLLIEASKLGPDVFLRMWLLSDPHAVDHVVIAGPPMLWSACGCQAVAGTFFFTGAVDSNRPPADRIARIQAVAREREEAFSRRSLDGAVLAALDATDQNLAATTAYGAAALRRAGETRAAAALAAAWTTPKPLPLRERRMLSSPLSWIWEATVPAGRPEQRDILHVVRHAESLAALEDSEDTAAVARRGPTVHQLSMPGTLADIYALARESTAQAHVDETFAWLLQLDQSGGSPECLISLRAEADLAVTNAVPEAIALLQAATSQHPTDMWCWHLLAAAYLQRGDTATVERVVLPAMQQAINGSDNDLVHLTQALLLTARGNPCQRQARDLFIQVADANPDLLVAREWALRLDMLLNDDAAIRRDATVLLSCEENHPQANYALALLAIRAMQLAEADRLFSHSLTGAMTPQAMVGRARLCFQRRMYADAMELAKKAMAEYPSYADARLVLADVLERMGKPSEAEVIRSEAQDAAP